MSALTGLGALLGGATKEAQLIKEERFKKEQSDLNLITSMLTDVMHNPYTSADVKGHAYGAMKDVLFEHLFPDQFKGNNKNPVRKLVDQFIGQQETGPASAEALKQLGVGRGNAKPTELGATNAPPPPPTMPSGSLSDDSPMPVAGSSLMQNRPPSLASAGISIPSSNGFYNQFDIEAAREQQKADIETKSKLSYAQQAWAAIEPTLNGLDPQQKAQVKASLFGGGVSLMPNPQVTPVERYDAENNKIFTDFYMHTPNGLKKQEGMTVEHPPSAEMQKYADDAKALFENAKSDPKSPFAGKSVVEIRQQLHLSDFQAREQALLAQKENIEVNKAYKQMLQTQIKQMMTLREQEPLVRLAREVDAAAERQYQNMVKAYETNAFELDPKTGKITKKAAPSADARDKLFDEIAKTRGTTGDTLRKAIQGLPKTAETTIPTVPGGAPAGGWTDQNDPGHLFH